MKIKAPGDKPLCIGLITGDTIVIEPSGTDVPVQFRKEAIARGCVPVGVDVEADQQDPEPTKADLLKTAIENLLESNDEEAFGNGGKPAVAALSKVAGFNVSASERDAAWAAFEADLKANEE